MVRENVDVDKTENSGQDDDRNAPKRVRSASRTRVQKRRSNCFAEWDVGQKGFLKGC